ncbi:hypothetical protein GCM10018952_03850 [Streptosporangium vulgare]
MASGAFTSGAEGVAVSGLVGLKMTGAGVLLAPLPSAAGLLAVFSGRGAKMTGSRRVGCPAWSVVFSAVSAGMSSAVPKGSSASPWPEVPLNLVRTRSPRSRAWPTPLSALCNMCSGRSFAFCVTLRIMSGTDISSPWEVCIEKASVARLVPHELVGRMGCLADVST